MLCYSCNLNELLQVASVYLFQIACSDNYAVLYADVQNSHKSALYCMTYDPGFHQLPTHREDAVISLIDIHIIYSVYFHLHYWMRYTNYCRLLSVQF